MPACCWICYGVQPGWMSLFFKKKQVIHSRNTLTNVCKRINVSSGICSLCLLENYLLFWYSSYYISITLSKTITVTLSVNCQERHRITCSIVTERVIWSWPQPSGIRQRNMKQNKQEKENKLSNQRDDQKYYMTAFIQTT